MSGGVAGATGSEPNVGNKEIEGRAEYEKRVKEYTLKRDEVQNEHDALKSKLAAKEAELDQDVLQAEIKLAQAQRNLEATKRKNRCELNWIKNQLYKANYDLQWASEPDQECSIDSHMIPGCELQQVKQCGHIYCAVCLTQVKERGGSCPACRGVLEWSPLKKRLLPGKN